MWTEQSVQERRVGEVPAEQIAPGITETLVCHLDWKSRFALRLCARPRA